MKTAITIIIFLFSLSGMGQDLLLISNAKTGEAFKIEEGKRIRVKLKNGKKRSGILKISGDGTVKIGNLITPIDQWVKVKRHPFVLTALFSVVTGYFAAISVVAGLVVAVFGDAVLGIAIGVIGGAGFSYASVTGINIMKPFKVEQGWQYSVQLME